MEDEIAEEAQQKLTELGVDVPISMPGGDEFVDLFFRFMKLELSDLEYEVVKDHSDKLFGFWVGNDRKEKTEGYANYMFGYGLYE